MNVVYKHKNFLIRISMNALEIPVLVSAALTAFASAVFAVQHFMLH